MSRNPLDFILLIMYKFYKFDTFLFYFVPCILLTTRIDLQQCVIIMSKSKSDVFDPSINFNVWIDLFPLLGRTLALGTSNY